MDIGTHTMSNHTAIVLEEFLPDDEELLAEWTVDALGRTTKPGSIAAQQQYAIGVSETRVVYRTDAKNLESVPKSQIESVEIDTTSVSDSSLLDKGKKAAAVGFITSLGIMLLVLLIRMPSDISQPIQVGDRTRLLVFSPLLFGLASYFFTSLITDSERLHIEKPLVSIHLADDQSDLHIVDDHETCKEIFRAVQ
jgi:hypothetical protein